MSNIPSYDEDHRKVMHEVVDLLFDHVQNVEDDRVVRYREAADLRAAVALPAEPRGGENIAELVQLLADQAIHLHHPSYMGHQVCPPFPEAVMAELANAVLNQSTAVWEMSPIATQIEKEVVQWLSNRVGYPDTAAGTAVSGGSAANLTGLLAARTRFQSKFPGVDDPLVLCSRDTHYSVARAASIAGIPAGRVIKIDTDDAHAMSPAALEQTLRELQQSGRHVLAIVATSGSTATGSFDDLNRMASLRDEFDTWLHVDAAHGASVLLSNRLAHLVDGLHLADSLAWDPHKMLWMSLSLGIVLVRDGNWLRKAFEADAPYLFGPEMASQNIGEMTIQCSKKADAVKLWLTLKTAGMAGFSEALDRVTELTVYLRNRVEAADDFVAMHDPQFNIFCFRYSGPAGETTEDILDDVNRGIREQMMRAGDAWITTTRLRGRLVLRTTIINPRTTEAHIDRMLDDAREIGEQSLVDAASSGVLV